MALGIASLAGAASGDTLVTVGSPTTPFSQNKQNEPAVAVDADHPNVVVAGANDEIDMEACNAGTDNTCPFTPGVGVSGVYFSFDSGHTWTQPTYTGLTGRNCLGVVGDTDPRCTPADGPIGTLPWYFENGLVSDGDPGVAFGPRRDAGPLLLGQRLAPVLLEPGLQPLPSSPAFRGFEAIAVSRTDDVEAAAANDKNAWMPPVRDPGSPRRRSPTRSRSGRTTRQAARSSAMCTCAGRLSEARRRPNAAPAPLMVGVSRDGGDTWSLHQVTGAANNAQRSPMDGCTVRTDSHGNAYVFGVGTVSSQGHNAFELMVTSDNGGQSWSRPRAVSGPVTQPGLLDPVQGRPVIDGVAGARSDLAPAPSVDIANGAPTGAGATNRMVMSYVSGEITKPHVFFTQSADGGATWSSPPAIEQGSDRGLYAAPAISPDGNNVYVVYNAFTTPFRTNTTDPRNLVGVVLHAPWSGRGEFTELHRSPSGDPRGSSANSLVSEFLGDYVYAAATNDYGVAVWNDVRNAADCPAIDAWRASLQAGAPTTTPAPEQDCPATFGNSDIWSFTTAP